ncbi:MAG: nucleotide-binding domain containing protein, partial [Pseudomonadota bacterium]
TATRAQIRHHSARHPARAVSAAEIIDGGTTPEATLAWAQAAGGLPLVYSSAEPEAVAAVQEEFGRETAALAIEDFFAKLAQQAVAAGVSRIITAGGETSGAVVEALDLTELAIGPEIDPGVPALRAGPDLVLALKSGNFGAESFFEKAAAQLGP